MNSLLNGKFVSKSFDRKNIIFMKRKIIGASYNEIESKVCSKVNKI